MLKAGLCIPRSRGAHGMLRGAPTRCSGREVARPVARADIWYLQRLFLFLERIISKFQPSLRHLRARPGSAGRTSHPGGRSCRATQLLAGSPAAPGFLLGPAPPVTPAVPCWLSLCPGPPLQGLPLPPAKSGLFIRAPRWGLTLTASATQASFSERGAPTPTPGEQARGQGSSTRRIHVPSHLIPEGGGRWSGSLGPSDPPRDWPGRTGRGTESRSGQALEGMSCGRGQGVEEGCQAARRHPI